MYVFNLKVKKIVRISTYFSIYLFIRKSLESKGPYLSRYVSRNMSGPGVY